ncbi:MAG: tyrosine--tRNA ligase [Bacteroidia bacterium]
MSQTDFITELRWRGMINNEDTLMPGTIDHLTNEKTAGYIGFDPTGSSLHIGNLATIMLLVHLQRAGHKPYALVGGATGMIGDPSGKDAERSLLDLETLRHNERCIKAQLEHFLDFDSETNPAEMVNNYDWFKDINFLDFLRDVGKHIPINYMMNKESVKKRLETGISYTEFAYQLVQGYDFMWLYENKGVRLQMGGGDQWGNITTGTELIRRKLGHESKAFALTTPLITREDGSKFGKTADGKSVWLDPKMTSPYEFYQYWININDGDLDRMLKVFTLLEQKEIEMLVEAQQADPRANQGKKALATEVTRMVHGASAVLSAQMLTEFLAPGKRLRAEDLVSLSESDWADIVANSDARSISADRLGGGLGILELLTELKITKSNGEARRAIQQDKAVSLNGERIEGVDFQVNANNAFFGKYMILTRGKKNKFLVEVA